MLESKFLNLHYAFRLRRLAFADLDLPRFTLLLRLVFMPVAVLLAFLDSLVRAAFVLRLSNHNITNATATDAKHVIRWCSTVIEISEGNVALKIPKATAVIADLIKLELINTSLVKLI